MKITLNERQLALLNYALEYYGRHCIGQRDFLTPQLDHRSDPKAVYEQWQTILDMRKVIEHFYLRNVKETVSIHKYDVHRMWTEKLMKIEE